MQLANYIADTIGARTRQSP